MKTMACHQISYSRCFALRQYLRFEETRIEEEVEELRGKMEIQIDLDWSLVCGNRKRWGKMKDIGTLMILLCPQGYGN